MSVRLRLLSPIASAVETVVGLWLLRGVLATGRGHWDGWLIALAAALAVVVLVGLVGLIAAARRSIRERSQNA
jgi:uncharacterized membrane protein